MPVPLTDKQRAIYEHLCEHLLEHGYQPCLEEVGVHAGLSVNGVTNHLRLIAAKGWLAMPHGADRSIRLLYWPDGTRFVGLQPKPDDAERYELAAAYTPGEDE